MPEEGLAISGLESVCSDLLFKEISKGACFEAEIKKSLEKENIRGENESTFWGRDRARTERMGSKGSGGAPPCRRGTSASEAEGQDGGRFKRNRFADSCK